MIKKIIKHLNQTELSIDYTTIIDTVRVHERFGAYLVEFYVRYEQSFKNCLASTYDAPEEFDITFEPMEISGVSIYINNELQDLSDIEIEFVRQALHWKVVHNGNLTVN